MKNSFISVVVPCYNEEKIIARTIARIDSYFTEQNLEGEIIVVDDGSGDETAKKAAAQKTRMLVKILKQEKKGKGAAVKKGVLNSSGNLILFSDADLSTDISYLGSFMKTVEAGSDIVIASRDMPESKLCPPQPFLRRVIGFFCRTIVRTLIMRNFRDTQCGFKLFRKEAAGKIFPLLKTDGFAFDIEVLYLAKKLGMKVSETGVVWRNSNDSKVRPLIDSLKFFIQIFLIKLRISAFNS
ncbi:MAG: glycosyltransferase [Elusimicrobia bacterium]|nr:glycosyltransferase [Elusimicrobiota bacterium]